MDPAGLFTQKKNILWPIIQKSSEETNGLMRRLDPTPKDMPISKIDRWKWLAASFENSYFDKCRVFISEQKHSKCRVIIWKVYEAYTSVRPPCRVCVICECPLSNELLQSSPLIHSLIQWIRDWTYIESNEKRIYSNNFHMSTCSDSHVNL